MFVYAMCFSDGMVKAVEAVIMVATVAEYASSLVSIIEEAEVLAAVQAIVILSELPMVVELKQVVNSTISVPIQVQ